MGCTCTSADFFRLLLSGYLKNNSVVPGIKCVVYIAQFFLYSFIKCCLFVTNYICTQPASLSTGVICDKMSSKFLNSHRFLKIIKDGFVDMTIFAEQFSYLLGWKSINNEWRNWSDHGHIQSNVWKKATAAHTHWPGNRKTKNCWRKFPSATSNHSVNSFVSEADIVIADVYFALFFFSFSLIFTNVHQCFFTKCCLLFCMFNF